MQQKIIFICQGNVGRSQMAEAFFNHFFQQKVATSCGIDATTPSRYQHPTSEVVAVMAEQNIDVSQQKVKHFSEIMHELANAQKIIVLCEDTMPEELAIFQDKMLFYPITDPFSMDIAKTRKVALSIKNVVLNIIDTLVKP